MDKGEWKGWILSLVSHELVGWWALGCWVRQKLSLHTYTDNLLL